MNLSIHQDSSLTSSPCTHQDNTISIYQSYRFLMIGKAIVREIPSEQDL